jgi:hypothetical protein
VSFRDCGRLNAIARCGVGLLLIEIREALHRTPLEALQRPPLHPLPLRSVTAPLAPVFVAPVAVLEPINGRTPGALQGDDYLLEYYADGFPILPACLDRRRARLDAAA